MSASAVPVQVSGMSVPAVFRTSSSSEARLRPRRPLPAFSLTCIATSRELPLHPGSYRHLAELTRNQGSFSVPAFRNENGLPLPWPAAEALGEPTVRSRNTMSTIAPAVTPTAADIHKAIRLMSEVTTIPLAAPTREDQGMRTSILQARGGLAHQMMEAVIADCSPASFMAEAAWLRARCAEYPIVYRTLDEYLAETPVLELRAR